MHDSENENKNWHESEFQRHSALDGMSRQGGGVLHFKHSHSDSDAWQQVSFHKRGRQHKLANFSLPQKYNSQRALPKNKVDDDLELLDYIPPVHHSFYNNLKSDPQLPVVETERLDESDRDDR